MRRWGMCSLLVVTTNSSPDALHEHFGQNVLIVVRQESAARARFETGDALERFLHFIDARACAAGDFRNAPFAERFHVIAHDAVFERVFLF